MYICNVVKLFESNIKIIRLIHVLCLYNFWWIIQKICPLNSTFLTFLWKQRYIIFIKTRILLKVSCCLLARFPIELLNSFLNILMVDHHLLTQIVNNSSNSNIKITQYLSLEHFKLAIIANLWIFVHLNQLVYQAHLLLLHNRRLQNKSRN